MTDTWLLMYDANVLEHQMFRVREDIQKYRACQLPRREERA